MQPKARSPKCITEIVAPAPDAGLLKQLEEHRVTHQLLTGRFVDLEKQYSSQLPADVQRYLLSNHERLYFDNLPEYVRDFIDKRIRSRAAEGRLDDADGVLLDGFCRLRRKGRAA